jgi:hypothetical protein
MINVLLGDSRVNMVQHETIEEDMFSVNPTDAPIDWIAIACYVFTVGPCPFRGYITRAASCKFRANWNKEYRSVQEVSL